VSIQQQREARRCTYHFIADRPVDTKPREQVGADERFGVENLPTEDADPELDLRNNVDGDVATHLDIVASTHVEALTFTRGVNHRTDVIRSFPYTSRLVVRT
jgi:hypothetical protein